MKRQLLAISATSILVLLLSGDGSSLFAQRNLGQCISKQNAVMNIARRRCKKSRNRRKSDKCMKAAKIMHIKAVNNCRARFGKGKSPSRIDDNRSREEIAGLRKENRRQADLIRELQNKIRNLEAKIKKIYCQKVVP